MANMFSNDEPNPYLEELENQLQFERNKNIQSANNQMSMILPDDDNLIRYQLDLKEIQEKIYHLLKGDVITEDKQGNIIYAPPEDDNLKPFNEFGTQLIMNIMSFYLNRNTLLSNYDEETIKWKILDFGNEISDLILCRYKDMMITTTFEKEFKKEYGIDCIKLPNKEFGVEVVGVTNQKQFMYLSKDITENINSRLAEHLMNKVQFYPMIVLELCDSLHSSLLRALDGGERESLRTARVVNQNETMGIRNNNMQQNQPNKKFSLFKPSSWM